MSVLQPDRRATGDPPVPGPVDAPVVAPADTRPVRARTGRTWLAIGVTTLGFVALVVFMLQNTRTTEITFLWMHGSAPLALSLLVASVGAAILTMVAGAARLTQLSRRRRRG